MSNGTFNTDYSNLPIPAGMGVGAALQQGGSSSGGGGFLDFLSNINLGDLASTGLSAAALNDAMRRLSSIGEAAATGAQNIGAQAQADSQFQPFTVTTGFGQVGATPEGGFTTTMSPQQQARQEALSGITGGLLGTYTPRGMGGRSDIEQQALQSTTGALTALGAPIATREADVFERIRAVQRPEEERQRLALQDRLLSQGRLGLQTAAYGGSPEQFALAQAQEEAKNRASLMALQQAGAERQQDLASAQGLFDLSTRAASVPGALTAADLGNIQQSLALETVPEQTLLSTLQPAINLAGIADLGRRQGAGYAAEGGMSGLELAVQTDLARADLLKQLYGGLLSGAGSSAGSQGLFSSLFDTDSTLGGLLGGIGSFLGIGGGS
jgi:hypothetical protein